MRFSWIILLSIAVGMQACSLLQPGAKTMEDTEPMEEIALPEVKVSPEIKTYRAADPRTVDLLHTELRVKFDWEKKHLIGEANLTFVPYFYPVSTFEIDAKGMDLRAVELVGENGNASLQYTYDQSFITIELPVQKMRTDTFKIYIDYTAKPDELAQGGSAAITGDKGLYFINADGSDANKMQQLWTQGETEASSCWFPTIDSPSEKTSQEIYLTVDDRFATLSNGELVFMNFNADGTRTDYWKQSNPHAPYLAMMAVGEFKIAKDRWERPDGTLMPVEYYLDAEYAPYAFDIFGNTPEMLTFYSEKLGYPYPWDKYSQVVVEDFVSGAMENTSATIHGDFVQATKRELIDGNQEDVIAHELFHHWFGDLVTCESWANLPLNESFATYGEYLWNEHKYGKDFADMTQMNDLGAYLAEARNKRVPLIRYTYDNKDDMFDAHSYQKGGLILHMLRQELGDDAFFAGLKHYLHKHAFKTAEVHDLRIAFEETCGRDLNWFFNQWFLEAGHPILKVQYEIDSLGATKVIIDQKQDLEKSPVFRLPLSLDYYVDGEKSTINFVLDKLHQEVDIPSKKRPDLVLLDPNGTLLCKWIDKKPDFMWAAQFKMADNYKMRSATLEQAKKSAIPGQSDMIAAALQDEFWGYRRSGLGGVGKIADPTPELEAMVAKMANSDENVKVRASALRTLAEHFPDQKYIVDMEGALQAESYNVAMAGLRGVYQLDPEKGLAKAKQFESEEVASVVMTLSGIYADEGKVEYLPFFENQLAKQNAIQTYLMLQEYNQLLANLSPEDAEKGLPALENVLTGESPWWVKNLATNGYTLVRDKFKKESQEITKNADPADLQAAAQAKKAMDKSEAIGAKLKAIQEG